ncbi:MAG: hypothetical protein FJ086_19440, partial [Deltaproteobacteria bacterium]|nr:hypothetical protein [Deltaproteobacteria bacterium]
MTASHLRLLPLLLLSAACVRVPPPDLGAPRAVDTGVPISFGSTEKNAPALEWDFGDGSPREASSGAAHAWARAGSYTVTARHDGEVLATVQVTAVPRAIERALPAAASGALYLRRPDAALERTVDFFERAFGKGVAAKWISGNPLVKLALELAAPSERENASDPEEGMGVFTVPGFDGSVGCFGIRDADRALAVAVASLAREGGPSAWTAPDGTSRVRLRDGRESALLVDRGYLYVVIPDVPAPPPEFADPEEDAPARDTGMNTTDFAPALAAIRGSASGGLEGTGLFAGADPAARAGPLFLYTRTDPAAKLDAQGAFASMQVEPLRMGFTAHVRGKDWQPGAGARDSGLFSAPAPVGPVAVLGLSIPPEDLVSFVFGAPGSEQRQRAAASAQSLGLPFEQLLAAFTGEVASLAWVDVPEMFRRMAAEEDPRPSPRGTFWVEAGLKDGAPLVVFLDALAAEKDGGVRAVPAGPGLRAYAAEIAEHPARLEISMARALMQLGEVDPARPREPLLPRLRARYGDTFLVPGHLSLSLDFGQLR